MLLEHVSQSCLGHMLQRFLQKFKKCNCVCVRVLLFFVAVERVWMGQTFTLEMQTLTSFLACIFGIHEWIRVPWASKLACVNLFTVSKETAGQIGGNRMILSLLSH